MTEIVDKVLSSGLVDKATIKLMEQWKYLPEGSSDKVREDALNGATQEVLTELANNLADAVVKAHKIKETALDLDRIKWPNTVSITKGTVDRREYNQDALVASDVICVVDRMGRYYFRVQDVEEDWFVPGYIINKQYLASCNNTDDEVILEAQVLYVGEQKACIQVSTQKVD